MLRFELVEIVQAHFPFPSAFESLKFIFDGDTISPWASSKTPPQVAVSVERGIR